MADQIIEFFVPYLVVTMVNFNRPIPSKVQALLILLTFLEGILTVDGETWTEQRKFTLRHLRDFGFGKNQMETLILDEAKELIEAFKIDEGKSITLGRRFNLAILNSLWLIVTGSRLNHDDLELNAILEDYFK